MQYHSLRSTMRQHGFMVAAARLDESFMTADSAEIALASWQNYPACMDAYPRRITKTKTVWNDSGVVLVPAF